MSIDSSRKRGSALSVALAATLIVVPITGIDQADRQTIGLNYSGILANIPVVDTEDCFLPLTGLIGNEQIGLPGTIDDTETAVSGIILAFNAFEGAIDPDGISLQGVIGFETLALNSNIQDSFGIQAELCDC